MAGHSKWANIKHRKARQDAKRGNAWSKCSKAIIVAAKNGGGDPEMNLTLRYAIEEAKAANMPKDTIAKAIKKGTGELEGESYEEATYEGYGPNGVAVFVECLTDNRSRTAPDVRHIFSKHGGNLGTDGSVAFVFDSKGLITIKKDAADEEKIMEVALEAGADDVTDEGDCWQVLTAPGDFHAVKTAIDAAGLATEVAELTMIANNTVACAGADAQKVFNLIEALEECDDVQKVHTNADIPEEELNALAGG